MRAEIAALEVRKLSRRRVKAGVGKIAASFADYDLLTYSSAISFQVLYVVVPLGLLALAGLGLVGEQSLYTDHIAPTLRHDLSHDAFVIADRTARKAMDAKRLWWATAGLVVTLWGAGSALRSMMTPLNAIYDAREERSWLHRVLISIGAGAIGIVCLLAAILVVLGGRLVHPHGLVAVPFFLGRWIAALALLLITIAVLIRLVPATKRPLEWVSAGSLLSAVCWIVATLGFGAYISAVSYSTFYGALASIVLLLVYLHVSAIAFLLGVTVDSLLRDEVQKQKRGRRR
jgi:YihY family inner membrane protein